MMRQQFIQSDRECTLITAFTDFAIEYTGKTLLLVKCERRSPRSKRQIQPSRVCRCTIDVILPRGDVSRVIQYYSSVSFMDFSAPRCDV